LSVFPKEASEVAAGEDTGAAAHPSSGAWEIRKTLPGGSEAPRYSAGDLVAGKYRLERVLGRGGMGDVWLAHNETLDIEVAVKLMRREADGPEAGSRFLREARAAARLAHPSIVRIFDFGLAEHREPFIVMERLVGEDLATALQRRGRLPAVHAVRTLLPIVNALMAAHAKGVIHRDLKPENVFLSRGEGERLEPKIVDFGVAKLDLPKELQLTKDGMLLGSPAYMPPEQAQGTVVDHRADIWSVAVVLYEMVAGERPFVGKTHNATLVSIGRDAPRPFTELSAGDDALWAIVQKALEKDRRRRWDSMRAFGEALARWAAARGAADDISGQALDAVWFQDLALRGDALGAEPAAAPAPREAVNTLPRSSARLLRRRLLVGGAALAALLVVMGGGMVLSRSGNPPKVPAPSSVATHVKPFLPPLHEAVGSVSPEPSAAVSAKASAATRHAKGRPIPVKNLSQIPVDRSPSRSVAKKAGHHAGKAKASQR
jgi:serine/threonine-protein kinase